MLKLATDENFNNDILRGILRRNPDLDILRIQDVGLSGADDPTVLKWAAQEERILLTHDVQTITRDAYKRGERERQYAIFLYDKIKELIIDMVKANSLWGAPRIHGELVKTGF